MRISDWSSDVCSSDLREFRKPLVVFTPKSLLRHKRCVSDLAAFGPGSCFHRVLYCDDRPSEPKDDKQVVLCSGKVYYDIGEERERRGIAANERKGDGQGTRG